MFLKDVGANYIQIALFYGISTIPWASQIYFADLAERIGKKLFLSLSLFISFLSLLLIFFIHNLLFLFTLGIVASFGISIGTPVLEGWVTKLGLRKEGEFTGVLEMIFCIGNIFGSLLGGFLSEIFYLNAPFLLASILMLISLLVLKKTNKLF